MRTYSFLLMQRVSLAVWCQALPYSHTPVPPYLEGTPLPYLFSAYGFGTQILEYEEPFFPRRDYVRLAVDSHAVSGLKQRISTG